MGGHAAPRAGRALDGSEGSHERRLERAHSAGEEGWYVYATRKLKEGRLWNTRIAFGWTNAACYSYGTSSARFLRDPDFGMTYRYNGLDTDSILQPTGSPLALTVPVLRHLPERT